MYVNESKIQMKAVSELLNEKFFIPSYQRGYRWTEQQVTELLNDIWDFTQTCEDGLNKGDFYCLQPIVVSKQIDKWVVLDGQQRLTTIYIILEVLKDLLKCLGMKNFSIQYETRPDSETFLKNIDVNECEKNIDYYHISSAYHAVKEWFADKGTDQFNFLSTLLNIKKSGRNVQFIWYDVTNENVSEQFAIDIFTRINIGKIPLTNSELIKALFLQKSNFSEQEYYLKQLQIASEWDLIEKKMQESSFWHFIYASNNPLKYENHIEYILDLYTKKNKENKFYYSFHKFNEELISGKPQDGRLGIERVWLKIKGIYQRFEEWYQDRDLYHRIGYLIECGIDINSLLEECEKSTKTEFDKFLCQRISEQIKDCNLDELTYGDNRIRKVLLLFNIQTIIASKKAEVRFPFNLFKDKEKKWDIEHIRSRTDKQIIGNDRKYWARDMLDYLTGEDDYTKLNDQYIEIEYVKELVEVLKSEKIDDKKFKELYDRLACFFKESESTEAINSISNLALLDAETNRSYKNAMFPIKRKRIRNNDMNGIFVPLCTKNVFMKFYSKKLNELMYWTEDDAEDYLVAIKRTLATYLPEQDKENESI